METNKVGNFKFIVAMELIIAGVKITPEDVLKAVWKKTSRLVLGFYI